MPSIERSRRVLMKTAGTSLLFPVISGCSEVSSKGNTTTKDDDSETTKTNEHQDLNELSFAAGWEFQSEEPVLEHSVLAGDDSSEMVSGLLIDDQETADRVKWDLLKEISSDFAGDFTNTAFDDGEFLVLVEVLLPKSHTIRDTDVTYEDGELQLQYEIVSADESSTAVTVNNSLEKWRTDTGDAPDDISVNLCYRSSNE